MENCIVPDHTYCKTRIIQHRANSGRKPRACQKDPCSSKDQPQVRSRQGVKRVSVPQKSRRNLVSHSSQPSGHPSRNSVPESAISPADLPVPSNAPPSPKPSCSKNTNSPIKIHNHTVEDYQKIYHEVADSMKRYKNGRARPYSLDLGRQIKQQLWERLNHPTIVTSTNEDGLTKIDITYGQEINPPNYDIDTSDEPDPQQPRKRRKKN